MFDLGATEILMIIVVAVLVIGPKDMPLAMRTAGRWMGKMRRISSHFRAGLDTMIREAEMEEMEKKWREQNEKIMQHHPDGIPSEVGEAPPAEALPTPESAADAPDPAKPAEPKSPESQPQAGTNPPAG